MPRVVCKSPNASNEISGVKFELTESGDLVSEEISRESADLFVSIPGYSFFEEKIKAEEPIVKIKAGRPKKSKQLPQEEIL